MTKSKFYEDFELFLTNCFILSVKKKKKKHTITVWKDMKLIIYCFYDSLGKKTSSVQM